MFGTSSRIEWWAFSTVTFDVVGNSTSVEQTCIVTLLMLSPYSVSSWRTQMWSVGIVICCISLANDKISDMFEPEVNSVLQNSYWPRNSFFSKELEGSSPSHNLHCLVVIYVLVSLVVSSVDIFHRKLCMQFMRPAVGPIQRHWVYQSNVWRLQIRNSSLRNCFGSPVFDGKCGFMTLSCFKSYGGMN